MVKGTKVTKTSVSVPHKRVNEFPTLLTESCCQESTHTHTQNRTEELCNNSLEKKLRERKREKKERKDKQTDRQKDESQNKHY
jgi:hypothetical protein